MLIELLVSRATIMGLQDIGDEIDVPDDEARRMIKADQAVPVRRKKSETTTRRTRSERAVK